MSVFYPLKWIKSIKAGSYSTITTGNAYEIIYGVPTYGFTVDNTPPQGECIINASLGKGGIEIHAFDVFSDSTITNTTDIPHIDSVTAYTPYIGSQFSVLNNININTVTLSFDVLSAAIDNGVDCNLQLFIYDDLNFLPNNRLSESTNNEPVASLSTSKVTNFTFNFPTLTLNANQLYWFVLYQTEESTDVNGNPVIVQVVSVLNANSLHAYSSVAATLQPSNSTWSAKTGSSFIYSLSAAVPGADALPGVNELADDLGNYLRDAATLGGASNEFEYEVIGDNQALIFQKYLMQSSPALPVKTIIVGCTSTQPKGYVIEVLPTGNSTWIAAFTMQSSSIYRDYVEYTFGTSLLLDAVRIRYLGDYYAKVNAGTITIFAQDSVSGCSALQASHFSDYRDVNDMPGSDINGWVTFFGGTYFNNWNMVNEQWYWETIPGIANGFFTPDPLLSIVNAPTTLVAVGTSSLSSPGTRIYQINTVSGDLIQANTVVGFDSSSPIPTVNCSVVHNGYLYFGMSDGSVYSTLDGTALNLVCTLPQVNSTNTPVTVLGSYLNYLYIGTSRVGNQSYIYKYNTNPNILSPLSFQNTFQNVDLSNMSVVGNNIYIGTSGDIGQKNGTIEVYSGGAWSQSYITNRDGVDFLVYSSSVNQLVAGLSSGQLVSLPFSSSLVPASWGAQSAQPYTGYTSCVVNNTGDRLFIVATTGSENQLASYKIATGQMTSLAIPYFYKYGLQKLRFTGSTNPLDSNYYRNLAYVGTPDDLNVQPTAEQSLFTYVSGDINNITSVQQYFMWKGWIRSNYSDTFTFDLTNNGGAILTIGEQMVIDNRVDSVIASTKSYSMPMVAGQWIPFQLAQYAANPSTEDQTQIILSLQWSSSSLALQNILVDNTAPFILTNTAATTPALSNTTYEPTSVQNDGNLIYTSFTDGKVYSFDYAHLDTTQRIAYVRFKDNANNISAATQCIDDIIQDPTQGGNTLTTGGTLFHIEAYNNTPLNVYDTADNSPALTGTRLIRNTANYDSLPYYVANLTQWDCIGVQAVTPTGVAISGSGLEYGTEIEIYIRNADNQADLNAAPWTLLTPTFNALNTSDVTTPSSVTIAYYDTDTSEDVTVETLPGYDLTVYNQLWMQYRIVFISATDNLTPTAYRVRLSYKETSSSYFFTEMFNFADYITSGTVPSAVRGFVSADYLSNNGRVEFGYTTDDSYLNTFDFTQYIPINLNTTFNIPSGTNQIRIGAMLSSTTSTPAEIDDFGFMLDFGNTDIKMMNFWKPFDVLPTGSFTLWLDATRINSNVVYITQSATNYWVDQSQPASTISATDVYGNIYLNRPGYDSVSNVVDNGNFGIKLLDEPNVRPNANRQKVNLPALSTLNGSAFTYSFVFSPDNLDNDKFYTLLCNDTGNDIIIALKVSDTNSSNILRVVSNGVNYDTVLIGTGYNYAFLPNTLYQLTITLSSSGVLTIYQNGSQIGSATGVELYTGNPILHIGTVNDTLYTAGTSVYYNFFGRIQEVLVFDTVLGTNDLNSMTNYALQKYNLT